jgi:DEAD/DEAH box helicase/Helicase conserved C-terminal domain
MNEQEYAELKSKVDSAVVFDFHESFALAKQCSKLLYSEEEEHYGRDLIIRILEHFDKVPTETHIIWYDLVEACGLQPYVDSGAMRGSSAVRHEFHQSRALPDVYLHREQLELSTALARGQSVVVSAPTSFGKSLLIEEIVAAKQYRNLVIIQPTLALLDETRKKLERYRNEYQLIVSTHQRPSAGRNIFLLTAERFVDYDDLPAIDFFVIDEFYKLSLEREDERAITLNQALYRLLKSSRRFYLLGPNIRKVSEQFLTKYEAIWHRSDYATVSVDVDRVYERRGWRERDRLKDERESELFNLLYTLDEPTMIYCSSPSKASTLADGFAAYLNASAPESVLARVPEGNSDIIQWVTENVHERWSLARALQTRVAFHHGHLPRHLGSSLVDAFNRGDVQYLFCTSTLIEGVNTSARNVVLFDRHKGRKPIDYFDYKNIVGRSGRMNIHYIGKVYEFHSEPSQLDLEVTVPLFEQAKAPLELLVQLEKGDISQAVNGQLAAFDALDEELKTLIRRNSGLPVNGQIALVKYIQDLADELYPLLSWTAIPTYRQLQETLSLCWRFFLRPKEAKGNVRNPAHLATMTLQYNSGRSLKYLIATSVDYWRKREEKEDVAVEKAVEIVLGVARNWFDYKLPNMVNGYFGIASICVSKVS